MNTLLYAAIAALIIFCAHLLRRGKQSSDAVAFARSEADRAQKSAIEAAQKMADSAGIDNKELVEIMIEQSSSVQVSSDVWSFDMPYGKWVEMEDPDGDPSPSIRGFWLDMKGRLIGVKMPIGSKYVMHHHPWSETLIGRKGLVWVLIEYEGGNVERKRLGPDDIVFIPAGMNHAVAKAEEPSEFICVWGIPQKS